MKKILLSIIIIIISVSAFCASFDITKNGKPNATVIKPKEITKAQEYAIDKFIYYIEQISGATLPTSETPTGKNDIYIGQTEPTKNLLKDFDWKSLKLDGIFIRCNGKDRLVITGDEKAGEIYAVYSFLEDYIGVKYYIGDEDYIPKKKTISINKVDYKYVPQMFYRESFYQEQMNVKTQPDYALKLKQNGGMFYKIPKEYGWNKPIIGCHSFQEYMNPEKYGKEHPEWFSYRDGKRILDPVQTQVCLTNEDMVKELTKNLLEKIEKLSDRNVFSVTQYDNGNYCECDKCKVLTEKYGPSGALLTVVNQIADVVAEKYPDVYLETFAYNYTQKPPLGDIKLRDNIIIRLCASGVNRGLPFDHPANEAFMSSLKAWANVAKNLYIWDYTVNYPNHLIPLPDTHVLQKDMQIIIDNKAVGIFSEGDEANTNGWLLKYKGYIIAKLSWDCNIDIDKETKGFCDFYYGPAGKDMYKYIKTIDTQMLSQDYDLRSNVRYIHFWSYDQWLEGFKILNEAISKVKDNEKYYKRVYDDLLAYTAGAMTAKRETYLKLCDAKVMPFDNSVDLMQEYLRIKDDRKVPSPAEHYTWDTHFNSLLGAKKTGTIPEEVKGLPDSQWVDFKPDNMHFWYDFKNNDILKVIDEPNAPNKRAIWLSSETKEWQMMIEYTYLTATKYNYADMYMTYKVVPGEVECDDAFGVGLYSHNTGFGCSATIGSNETPDGKYITKKIGTVDFNKTDNNGYFYVAGREKPKATKGLYVDRIFFVYHD